MKSLLGAAAAATLLAVAPAWAQSSQSLSTQDRTFVKETESANLAQVKLGQMAEQKASKPAVQELGQWIATDDTLANKRLEAIAQKAGDHQQPTLTEKDKSLQKQLQGASGSQFDAQYLKAVDQAEKKGIAQFKSEAQSGKNAKLKTYAKNLTPVLEQHLGEAEELGSSASAASGSSAPPASTGATNQSANPPQK